MSATVYQDLIGKTLHSVKVKNRGSGGDKIVFIIEGGEIYEMYHEIDCCESVTIDDICGELEDIIGSPLLVAEETTNRKESKDKGEDESFTWTFYRFATQKGWVVIKWYGTSNGFYSEGVDFERVGHVLED